MFVLPRIDVQCEGFSYLKFSHMISESNVATNTSLHVTAMTTRKYFEIEKPAKTKCRLQFEETVMQIACCVPSLHSTLVAVVY